MGFLVSARETWQRRVALWQKINPDSRVKDWFNWGEFGLVNHPEREGGAAVGLVKKSKDNIKRKPKGDVR